MISQMALDRSTAVMVKDVETRRIERVQIIHKSQKVFDQTAQYTELLLQKGGFPDTSSPILIGNLSLDVIASVKAALLVAFVRVRKKEES